MPLRFRTLRCEAVTLPVVLAFALLPRNGSLVGTVAAAPPAFAHPSAAWRVAARHSAEAQLADSRGFRHAGCGAQSSVGMSTFCLRMQAAGSPGGPDDGQTGGSSPRSYFRRNSVKFHGRPSFQEPMVVPAAEEHTATMIFLHGFGSQGPGRGQLVSESINIPWCKIVCPLAPQRPAALGQALQSWSSVDLLLRQRMDDAPRQVLSLVNITGGVFAEGLSQLSSGQLNPERMWGKVSEQVLESRRLGLTPIKGDVTDDARNVEFIKQLIRAEERAGIPPERIVLVGFSQGGCQAISCALQMNIRLAGVVAISTWFPQGQEDTVLSDAVHRMPIFVAHGDSDWVVPVEMGRAVDAKCRDLGLASTYVEYAGLGHDISPEVVRGIRRFFQEKLPRVPPADVSVWQALAEDIESNDLNII